MDVTAESEQRSLTKDVVKNWLCQCCWASHSGFPRILTLQASIGCQNLSSPPHLNVTVKEQWSQHSRLVWSLANIPIGKLSGNQDSGEMKHTGIDKSGETRLFSLWGLGMWQWVVILLCPNPGATELISRPFLCMFYYPKPMYLAVISSTESTALNSLRRYSHQQSSRLICLCGT